MKTITSPQNSHYKNAMQLHKSRGRQKQNRIIVFGLREVSRAIQAGLVFAEIMIDPERVDNDVLTIFRRQLPQETVALELTDVLFEKLSYGDRVDGVIGIASRPATNFSDLSIAANLTIANSSFIVVLESLDNPGNLGAIVRSADGSGAAAVLIIDPQTDVFHPNAIRSSMSAVFSVPLVCASADEAEAWLLANQYQVYVGTPEAKKSVYETDLVGRIAFLFGNEAFGLSRRWREGEWNHVKLPMLGIADSLNVSVTASLMMYEARRQINARSSFKKS